MNNHVIDPTYFWDAIEEFSFDYDIYVDNGESNIDNYGLRTSTYTKSKIRGSIQSLGTQLQQSKSGNTHTKEYNFYCKSLYQINIGDIIDYKGNYLRCIEIMEDYDEYGVRAVKLEMIKLTQYRDFANYLKYIRGENLV